jgi:hypothetical protein
MNIDDSIGGGMPSVIKKTEKLTLKPFDIKKGGGIKLASKPKIGADGMKEYLNPYSNQPEGGIGGDEDIEVSTDARGMGMYGGGF